MKLVVVNKLLVNRGWQLVDKTSRMNMLSPDSQLRAERLIVLPSQNTAPVPTGTLEAIMRRAGQVKSTQPWHCALFNNKVLHLTTEKTGDHVWGRLDVSGLLLVVRGTDMDCLIAQIRESLAELLSDTVSDACQLVESLQIEACQDLTEVWHLLRQIRGSYLADNSGVDLALVNQFIGGTAFPSAEQTCKLRNSIVALGHQLLQLAG
jgi:predicted RNA binding protein YcfA (HicA-like mRNA interferase family)